MSKKKEKLKKLNTRTVNKKLIRKEVLNNCLKFESKELRYELAQNLENLKEKATRLQKCIAENGTLEKSFAIQELESWKLIKQTNLNLILHSFWN